MTHPTLQIIVSSTRPGRSGVHVAQWVQQAAIEREAFEVELVDLAQVALPLLDEPNHPSLGQYTKEHTRAWSSTVGRADAFIFVIPEYNHSFPASMKNALDYLHAEWAYKPVGLVSYGGVSAGLRSATALKVVLLALRMIPMHAAVSIPNIGDRVDDGGFRSYTEAESSLDSMLMELARSVQVEFAPGSAT